MEALNADKASAPFENCVICCPFGTLETSIFNEELVD